MTKLKQTEKHSGNETMELKRCAFQSPYDRKTAKKQKMKKKKKKKKISETKDITSPRERL